MFLYVSFGCPHHAQMISQRHPDSLAMAASPCSWSMRSAVAVHPSDRCVADARWAVSASSNTVQDLITADGGERASEITRDMAWLNLLSLAQLETG